MKLWNEIKNEMMQYPTQKICEGNAHMTYEEVVIYSEIFAEKLKSERCCAILCASEMMCAVALLSCFAADVTAVPLSVRYGGNHCRKILKKIGVTAIITDVCGELEVVDADAPFYEEASSHVALIMCTSGTTGEPKGSMLSETNILSNVSDICFYMKTGPNDKILISRPLYHCAVLTGEFLCSLFKGAEVRFCSDDFNPVAMLDIIEKYGITVLGGTPTILGALATFIRKRSPVSVQSIVVSGECMNFHIAEKLLKAFPTANIYHVYGLTEACPRVSYLPPHLFSQYPTCVGIPLRSVQIKIVKNDGMLADTGESGMLWVKGENIMMGYYKDKELTDKVLKKGWLCTGDIAVVNDEGLLEIKGRSDDLIIRAGMNIYPTEIENVLRTDKRVREVLVYGIKDEFYGERIGLKISGDFQSVSDVQALCTSSLPSYQCPSRIDILPQLPKSASGKIIRR